MLEDKSSLEETGCSLTERVEIFIIPFCLYSPPTCHSSQYYVHLSVTRSDSLILCSSLGVSASLAKVSFSHLPLGLLDG